MKFLGGLVVGMLLLVMGWWMFIPAIAGFLVGLRYKGKPWKKRILVFLVLMLGIACVLWLLFSLLLRSPSYIIAQAMLLFVPMTALAYFPATTKWKEWKVVLALVAIFIISISVLFTMAY